MIKSGHVTIAISWTAVVVSTALASFWAFWGAIEAFHEGWFYESFWKNVGLTLGQYLLPMLVIAGLGAIGVIWPRVGALLHVVLAAVIGYIVNTYIGRIWIVIPLCGLAALYWFSRFPNRRWVVVLLLGLPAVTAVVSGADLAWRTAHRVDDGFRGTRTVEGPGIRLRWAPAGPGWPHGGSANWQQAMEACDHLTPDGANRSNAPQHVWRLPTIDEVVRSLSLHGQSAGGQWHSARGTATYGVMPEKESPLWNPYSPVVYWWTATEIDTVKAYRIHFRGGVQPTMKSAGPTYYGFRCVSVPD